MAQKKITDLQLISAVIAGLSIPGDDGIQSYRFTPSQLYDYLRPLIRPQSNEIGNIQITAAVGSSALTIALKTNAATDPSSTDKIRIGFRSATLTSGAFLLREISSALSLVVSSGSTLGHSSGNNHWIYLYAIDNAGTVELAVSSVTWDEGQRVSTTAEGGSGAADSNAVMYSTTARTNVACRLIGRFKSNQATAGTWAAVPTEIALVPFDIEPIRAVYTTATAGSYSNSSETVMDYGTKVTDSHNCVVTGASWLFTAPKAGPYSFHANNSLGGSGFTGTQDLNAYIAGTKRATAHNTVFSTSGHNVNLPIVVPTYDLAVGDTIQIKYRNDTGSTRTLNTNAFDNYIMILGPK